MLSQCGVAFLCRGRVSTVLCRRRTSSIILAHFFTVSELQLSFVAWSFLRGEDRSPLSTVLHHRCTSFSTVLSWKLPPPPLEVTNITLPYFQFRFHTSSPYFVFPYFVFRFVSISRFRLPAFQSHFRFHFICYFVRFLLSILL